MTDSDLAIMRSVLTIGPSIKGRGGMESVLTAYRESIPGFKLLPTNSPLGLLPGLIVALGSALRMPLERLRGRRILHVHTASGKSFVRKSVFISWARLLGFKVIFHSHCGASKDYFRSIGIPKARRTLAKASAIVVLSEMWKEYYESTFHFDNVHILNNPVYIPEHPCGPDSTEPLRMLYLGKLCDDKGIFDLLDVMAMNAPRWRGRVHLTVGGMGEDERLVHFIAEQHLEDMVEFVGWVTDAKKEEAFARTHLLILPSYYEGLPVSILEAMAHGKAVISTPVGGIPEVVDSHRNGILFPAGDKKEMAHAIDCYLLNPDLLARHGALGRRKVQPYAADAIAAELLHIYKLL